MSEHDREEWGLQVFRTLRSLQVSLTLIPSQPYDVQEAQGLVLLGVHGPLVHSRHSLALLQHYDEKAGTDARDSQSQSRASLNVTSCTFFSSLTTRLVHKVMSGPLVMQDYNRSTKHEQSAKLSVEPNAKTENKMDEMQTSTRRQKGICEGGCTWSWLSRR